jgi:hypothetical protein
MKLLKKIITLLIVFSAMNINMLYGDVIYDFGTHVIMCFGDGDGHGGYLVGECITFYRDDQKREENNSGGGSGTTSTSGSSTFTPTPTTTDEPTGGSGGTTGGTGTIGDDTVTDKPTLDDNKPPLEEPEPICRCSGCEVCGGCLLSDVPEECEPCTCPEAPEKIDFKVSSDKERIEAILKALQSDSCVLNSIFSNFPVSYQSPGNGTMINICGQSFLIIISVGSFNDDFARYGYQTRSYYENRFGCWQPINVGNNGTMRISISCDNNLRNFTNCIF